MYVVFVFFVCLLKLRDVFVESFERQRDDGDEIERRRRRDRATTVTKSSDDDEILGKNDKFTVRTLYEMFKEKPRSMPTLERLSLGTAIITEAVVMAENPSSKIPRDRLQRYMNYRLPKMAWGKTAYSILMRGVKSLSASSWTGDSYEVSGFALAINFWAMSSVNVLGKSLGKPCETSSSSDPLCLHWDSTRTPTITEVLELKKINNEKTDEEENKDEEYQKDKEQRKDKDHSMSNSEKLDKLIQMVLSLQEDGFKGSWFRAILEQNPTRVKGKKLRVCYKTLFNEDGVNPCKETIERCFIRPVPPECLNEGVVFKEGSVVDAYFNNGWWTGLILKGQMVVFLVYFDDPPNIMRFIRSQLRPHANWIGSEWVKSKNKVLSQHMFRTGKLVEMTPEISEKIQGGYRRNFLIKRCTISQNSSDKAEGKHSIVDICKIMPSPPRDLCAEYNLNDYVEVVVTHGWRKGRVTEILLENNYKLWALSSVNQPGTFFGIRNDEIQFPLCLHWIETKSLTIEEVNRFDKMEEVDVKCIFGDPELHNDLVEDVDSEFGRVVDLVKRGYRLKRQDWLNGSVDIAVAEAEVDENNSAPGIDATGQEKIEFLTKMVVSLEEKVKYLEGLLNIRGETVKETEKSKETEADTKTKVYGQNADYEFDETEFLQNYIDAKRQEIAKGKKNGVRPPREVDHQDEDDIEVEHGAKESDTSKVNEPQEENEHHEEDDTEVDVDDSAKGNENSETNKGQTQEEEEQQQEDDTEVNADVDVGAKESENSETNEDGEVNEDAFKKPVKVTKKRGRGNKGKKKSVKPPREVQQQVEDDAEIGAKESENPETNEDGEMNEDASKKPLKVTKKRGRGNKGMKKGVTPPREVQQQVEDDADVDDEEVNEDAFKKPVKGTKKRGRETKGMKKGVAPPREVQQQVEYDAEVDAKESENPKTNEDGEVNEDASKKHVKFTKKCERVTKEPNVDTSKSKRQKKTRRFSC
ncbi:LOW QUALITY PROTEIN: hypothetical protein HID58_048807 [Brassica napus]|uniref:Agenet domain-containing protein n=2 Tax=Brassica TaxID=3705 RepID=A0ABQ8B362_BRANA|nr:LOW QUALITY PROTEIN: hypothetical protein HID58_048807 [Brassica napus]